MIQHKVHMKARDPCAVTAVSTAALPWTIDAEVRSNRGCRALRMLFETVS